MMDSTPLAHGPGHPLTEHLRAVAAGAAESASGYGSHWAALAGLWHDLGKFRPGFQRYVRESSDAHIEGKASTAPTGREKTHSAAGALHAMRSFEARFGPGGATAARALAYVIAGHHAGLDNWHDGLDPRLLGGNRDHAETEYREAVEACARHESTLLELPVDFDLRSALTTIPGSVDWRSEPLAASLWIRMLFSALVDADFLDTEAYFDRDASQRRAGFAPIAWYREALNTHLDVLTARVTADARSGDPVMSARAAVLAQCRAKAALPPGVFSLAVPTGGGKTLASMAFALAHAEAHGLRRIVVAIPYTSIVEQTADVLGAVFGAGAIVEHHSQADADDDRRDTARSRLACENWDAPVIVTTNVQLLESLFARRTSRCRKLHRLAHSVIVLDEAQLLPPPFLQPVLDALRVLVKHYGVTLLLCTATQPVLTASVRFDPRQSLRGLPAPRPIVDDPAPLYASLDRVRFEWPADWHAATELPDLARVLAAEACVLAVVNTRADAAELASALDAAAVDRDGERTLHLSAAMCGQHRADVITEIRARLAARHEGRDTRPLRVLSTQLVEAGVDIDFPVVYRALAGLDSIAQAAGRCNREGRLGARGGRVVVFVRPIPAPLAALRFGAQATIATLASFAPPALGPAEFERYFPLYYANFPSRDERGIVDLLRGNADFAFDFRTAAERFRLVDDEGQASVLVPYLPAGAQAGIEPPIQVHVRAIEAGQADRWRLRALQRYVVSARQRDLAQAQARGDLRELLPGLYLLVDALAYDRRLGLKLRGRVLDPATLVQ